MNGRYLTAQKDFRLLSNITIFENADTAGKLSFKLEEFALSNNKVCAADGILNYPIGMKTVPLNVYWTSSGRCIDKADYEEIPEGRLLLCE